MDQEDRGILNPGEPHPAAEDAMRYLANLDQQNLATLQAALSSCAIEGNRLAEVCSETLSRLQKGQPVSDRYLLGLAWFAREYFGVR